MRIYILILYLYINNCWCQTEFDFSPNAAIDVKDKKDNFNTLGVALGGGARTFLDKKFEIGISNLTPSEARLEAITADYRDLYDPDSNQWDFSKLDKEIDNMKKLGIKDIIANVFYTPKFLSSCPNSKSYAYCSPKDLHQWSNYVKSIVTHVYKKYGVMHWEIGNEPSGKVFFNAPMSKFYIFYIVTARSIKEVDSNILVGGYADNAFYINAYDDFFKKIHRDDPSLLNFVTFHWYGDWSPHDKYNPRNIFKIAATIKQKLKENEFDDIPIFLTEWNMNAEGTIADARLKVVSYFIASQFWIAKSPINKNFFFRVEPYSKTNSSLLNSSGQITPVGFFFSQVSEMYRSYDVAFYENNNVYVIFSPKSRKVVVTRYDGISERNKIHSNDIEFSISNVSCDKIEPKSMGGNFVSENIKISKVQCENSKLHLSVLLKEYQSAIIKY